MNRRDDECEKITGAFVTLLVVLGIVGALGKRAQHMARKSEARNKARVKKTKSLRGISSTALSFASILPFQ